MKAYALIKTASGTSENAIKELKTIKEVEKANQVSGIYDIIATIQFTDSKESNEIIEEKIRSIANSVITCTIIE